MTDKITKAERSRVMRSVRSRGNASTELRITKLFKANKVTGWRRHYPILGKPDFVFRKPKIAIFIDGCFWHGCPTCYRAPKSSQEYWSAKVERNKARDLKVTAELEAKGWRVLRVWECQLKKMPTDVLQGIVSLISERAL